MTEAEQVLQRVSETRSLLDLTNIWRWQIIEMTRPQSVAEHSYRVWVFALSIYDYLLPVPHNSFERDNVSHWALCHDAEEVFMGDMPANLKDLFKTFDPEICKKVANKVREEHLPSIAAAYRGIYGSTAYYMVGLADIIEAMDYAWTYTRDPAKKDWVMAYLGQKMQEKYAAAVAACPGVDWPQISQWAITHGFHHCVYFTRYRGEEHGK